MKIREIRVTVKDSWEVYHLGGKRIEPEATMVAEIEDGEELHQAIADLTHKATKAMGEAGDRYGYLDYCVGLWRALAKSKDTKATATIVDRLDAFATDYPEIAKEAKRIVDREAQ